MLRSKALFAMFYIQYIKDQVQTEGWGHKVRCCRKDRVHSKTDTQKRKKKRIWMLWEKRKNLLNLDCRLFYLAEGGGIIGTVPHYAKAALPLVSKLPTGAEWEKSFLHVSLECRAFLRGRSGRNCLLWCHKGLSDLGSGWSVVLAVVLLRLACFFNLF